MLLSGDFTRMNGTNLTQTADLLQLDTTGNVAWQANHAAPWKYADFGPDFAPRVAGDFFGSVEIAGEVLTAGTEFIARLDGPIASSAAPTSITLSARQSSGLIPSGLASPTVSVPENSPIGTVVASLSANDADSTSFRFQLFGGLGDDGNPLFAVNGTDLVTRAVLNFEELSQHSVRLRVVDDTGQTHEQSFLIGVTDVPDSIATTIVLSQRTHVYDGQPHAPVAFTFPGGVPVTILLNGSTNVPTAAGPYAIHATVAHPDYSGSITNILWIRTPLQDWLKAFYSNTDLDDPSKEATVWGPAADPDGDGIRNLFENYHGLNPSFDDALAARLQPGFDANNYRLQWQRAKTNVVGMPMIQWSTNLANWYNSGSGPSGDTRTFQLQVDSDNGATETLSARHPKGAETMLLLRLAFP